MKERTELAEDTEHASTAETRRHGARPLVIARSRTKRLNAGPIRAQIRATSPLPARHPVPTPPPQRPLEARVCRRRRRRASLRGVDVGRHHHQTNSVPPRLILRRCSGPEPPPTTGILSVPSGVSGDTPTTVPHQLLHPRIRLSSQGPGQCPKPVVDWSMAGSSTMLLTVRTERDETRISGTNGTNHSAEPSFRGLWPIFGRVGQCRASLKFPVFTRRKRF